MSTPSYLKAATGGIFLAVKLQPRASKTAIAGVLGNELRITVTAPPVDAAANQALIDFLCDLLDAGKSQVTIVRGQTSRHKTLCITGIPLERLVTFFPKA